VVSLARIEEAASVIDPVFLASPQFFCDRLSEELGFELVSKIECVNPIRSFKGRGASYFAHRHHDDRPHPWVCASAGNFGQGLAYAARARGIPVLVFASKKANPFKVARMRALGAEVRLVGEDFDAAKEESRRYAEANGLTFVEDGREPAISEGAGTIAIELLRDRRPFDALLVPLGNGALINGIGTWMKARSPATEVIGVGAERAPAMERSFRARRPIPLDEPVATIADGVATRVPVPEAVETMLRVVDDVLLVEEDAIVGAMRVIFRELGLVVEGAGAVTLAAAAVHRERFRDRRVATIVGGGNATRGEIRDFLCGGDVWESE
jgi:threonine dehydratase